MFLPIQNLLSNIQILLQQRKLSSRKMLLDLNFSLSSMSEWKSGKTKPSIEHLVKISDYFGVSIDYLLGLDSMTLEENEITKIYNQLDDKGKKELLEKAKEIQKNQQLDKLVEMWKNDDTSYLIADDGDSKTIKLTPEQQKILDDIIKN